MKKLLEKVSDLTMTDYNEEDTEAAIEDLIAKYLQDVNYLMDHIKNLEDSIREDYRPITKSEMYGISERDFI